jgi:hypothetical protein
MAREGGVGRDDDSLLKYLILLRAMAGEPGPAAGS